MRVFQIIISACLVVVCLFVLAAAGIGVNDALNVAEYKTHEREEGLAAIDMLEGGIGQLMDNEQTYLDGIGTYEEGLVAYQNGQAQYAAGLAQYYSGVEEYNAGLAEYNAGKQQIEDNTQAYNDGKQQLEQAETIYNFSKQFTESYNESGYDLPITGAIVDLLNEKVITTYEDGQAQIQTYEDGLVQLEEAEVALSDGRAQLATGQSQLAAAQGQLADGASQLEDGLAQLAVFEDGEKQVAEGVETLFALCPTLYRSGSDEIAVLGVKERVGDDFSSYQLDETGAVMTKNNVEYLDFKSCLLVADAGRAYIEDQTVDVTAEVLARVVTGAIAAVAALLGLIAGILGLAGKTRAPIVLGAIAAVLAVGANVYGTMTRYTGYTYPLEDGTFTGGMQLAAFLLLAAAAVVFLIAAIVIGSRMRKKASVAAAPTAADVSLAERLDALEAENATLRARLESLTSTAPAGV